MEEVGKLLVRRLFDEVFTKRNLDAADDLVADEYVEHAIAPFGARSRARSMVLRTHGRSLSG